MANNSSNLLDGIKSAFNDRWKVLDANTKRKVVKYGLIGLICIVGLVGYSIRQKNMKSAFKTRPGVEQKKEITLDTNILEKSKFSENEKELTAFKTQVDDLQKQIEELKKQPPAESKPEAKDSKNAKNGAQSPVKMPNAPLPLPMPFQVKAPFGAVDPASNPPSNHFPPPPGGPARDSVKPVETYTGEIEVVSAKREFKKEVEPDKKKGTRTVHLPISFMEATLLSGLNAPTSEGAKGQPMPALLRVKTPAILPNDVKANLKGCFVVVHGYGSLADERAYLSAVAISCILKNGQGAIESKITGYIADSDGSIGLRGKVVSKMGQNLVRSALAGFVSGVGQAAQTAYQPSTTILSGIGVQTNTGSVPMRQILESGAGAGVGQAGKDLSKFFLDLAKQTIPVVEVKATRPLTLVLTEGVDLQIKDICTGGEKCDGL